jgi:hypothetical protein
MDLLSVRNTRPGQHSAELEDLREAKLLGFLDAATISEK